jgi:hypothetical protein
VTNFVTLLRTEKYYLLLVVELLFLLILPFLPTSGTSTATIIAGGLSAILLAGLNAYQAKRFYKTGGIILVVVFIFLSTLFQADHHPYLYFATFVLFFAMMIMVDFNIMQNLLLEKEIKASSIVGSLAGYLMIAIGFAFFLVTLSLNGLEPLSKSLGELGFPGIMYFSLASMTTIGYGDIVAVHPFIQICSTLVAVLGQFYIAVVVAIIIGKLMNKRHPRS